MGSSPLSLSLHIRILLRTLTVKLRGRTTTPDKRRGRTLSPGARGAKRITHHGPLQRLLDDGSTEPLVARFNSEGKRNKRIAADTGNDTQPPQNH